MTPLDSQQQAARTWFESLRDSICAEFESIEREAGSDATFEYTPWDRTDPSGEPGGGGVRGVMKGRVFEKVGVNVSTVGGAFEGDFAKTIHGAGEDPSFFATGISLVAHMANPHVPAVHMNTRFLCTTKRWFGGGADLNPPLPVDEDTADFHRSLKSACDKHDSAYYPRFKAWADDYFYIPHRKVHRGVGGIFYDHLEGDWDANFAFTQDVGRAFLDIYPKLVRRRMATPFTDAEVQQQRVWRGRYAEFNLIYDRGTLFGLKTGGNVDAILMSLPGGLMGLTPVPDRQIATIVTSLEMRERPKPRPTAPSPLSLIHWPAPSTERYRTLFRRVGEPWLWFSRLVMSDSDLRTILDNPKVEVYAATDRAGIELGMLELDFRVSGTCELSYFGLVPEVTGRGNGGWLMGHALALAWRAGIERVWVHTCTLDHPSALGFYQRHGFVPYKRMVETFDDPRVTGLIPAEAAPQIPCLAPVTSR